MAVGGKIGANLADILETAGVMTETGVAAIQSGVQASRFSAQMEAEISDVTTALANHFIRMADDLRGRIAQAKHRLAATDWQGASHAAATQAETALNHDVARVLDHALRSTEEFKTFMLQRANSFASAVNGDFKTVMGAIDIAYQELAAASKTFAENLRAADESIRFSR
ncbi:MAG: hypothetical protein ACRDZO_06545 [Egibacteraceae bacterium]